MAHEPEISGIERPNRRTRASGDRSADFLKRQAVEHLKACFGAVLDVYPDMEPIDLWQWAGTFFSTYPIASQAAQYIQGFTAEHFILGWKAKISGKSKAMWSGNWIKNARSTARGLQAKRQESEAALARVRERSETNRMVPEVKALTGAVGQVSDSEAREAGWAALPEKERDWLRETARTIQADGTKAKCKLSYKLGEVFAKGTWWREQKEAPGE